MINHQEDISEVSSEPNPHVIRRYAFPKSRRLLTAAEFSAVFKDAPLRVSHPSFLILARTNAEAGPRLGLVVAKKYVKRATRRNTIKRITRESFRLQQHNIPKIDAIVLARRGADAFDADELAVIMNGLWKRLAKRAVSQATN